MEKYYITMGGKKIFDRMFDLPGHIIYWVIVFRAHKNISKEIKKNIFFPALQMSSLLETAGQR